MRVRVLALLAGTALLLAPAAATLAPPAAFPPAPGAFPRADLRWPPGLLPGTAPPPGGDHLVGPFAEALAPFVRPFDHVAGHLETLSVSAQGASEHEWGQGLARDASGNLYMTGYVYTNSGVNPYDVQVGKWNAYGQPVWLRRVHTSLYEVGHAVAAAPDGDVYVAGYRLSSGWSGYHAFLMRLTSEGALVWSTPVPLPGQYAFGQGVSVKADGDVVVSGFGYDPGQGQYRAFAAGFHPSGGVEFSGYLESPAEHDEYAFASATGPDGSVVLAGHTYTGYGYEAVLHKLDASGTPVARGTFQHDEYTAVTGVAVDPSGHVAVSGITSGEVSRGLVARLTPGLALQWMATIAAGQDTVANGVAVDKLGGIAVAGYAYGGDVSRYDVLVARFLPTGGTLFTRTIDVAGDDFAMGVAMNDLGTEIATGGVSDYGAARGWDFVVTRSLGFSTAGSANGALATAVGLEEHPPAPPGLPVNVPSPSEIPQVCARWTDVGVCVPP